MDREHEEYLCALSDFERMGKEATDPAKKASYERICAEIRAKLWPPQMQQPQDITRAELAEWLSELVSWEAPGVPRVVWKMLAVMGFDFQSDQTGETVYVFPLAAPIDVRANTTTIRVTPRPDGPPRLEMGEAR